MSEIYDEDRIRQIVPLVQCHLSGPVDDPETHIALLFDMLSRLSVELGALRAEVEEMKDENPPLVIT